MMSSLELNGFVRVKFGDAPKNCAVREGDAFYPLRLANRTKAKWSAVRGVISPQTKGYKPTAKAKGVVSSTIDKTQ